MDPEVGAVLRGAEITRLGAVVLGAEVPRTHNEPDEVSSNVARILAL